HVEVQVLADAHGSVVQLGERDCSVQRRHQKVIEESPSPAVTPELRAALGDAAIRVARAAGYVNAGTCEFLLDAEKQFFFIEMNARLQVEHPVTELVTGLDLVRQQLRIAAGEPLGFGQEDVALRGHAIECRLYAEDPARDFLPSTGVVLRYAPPLGAGLRHDLGVDEGGAVTPYYDTMLGKLIVHGADRAAAIARARTALDEYRIEGVATNLPLLRWVLGHPAFRAGMVTTDFLAREWRPAIPTDLPPAALAAAAAYAASAVPSAAPAEPWLRLGPWRVAGQGIPLAFVVDGLRHDIVVSRADAPDGWLVAVQAQRYEVSLRGEEARVTSATAADGETAVRLARRDEGLVAMIDGREYLLTTAAPPSAEATTGGGHAGGGPTELRAPMPGRVVRVAVAPGDRVLPNQTLVILEAMKIEHAVAAPRAALVRAVHCRPGDTVDGGALLVELASDDGQPGAGDPGA
ncbi:MAG: 3-methylcrotonyl-CoA carboxylase, partial [Chloroflexota bacterium]|nr:3-methylcrotonyl-CoA carboxylase [Chloroflexota bacterium]